MRDDLTINLGNLLLSFSDAVDIAVANLGKHQERTAYIAWKICLAAGVPETITVAVFTAALLHDIGAITADEYTTLHSFEVDDVNPHCIKGELLLNRVPELQHIAKIVRNHHRPWSDWNEDIANPLVLASQILCLADQIERALDPSVYVLYQKERVLDIARILSDSVIHNSIVTAFKHASKAEAFWFEIVSPRLYSILYDHGPLKDTSIGYHRLEDISKLLKDVIDYKSPFTASHTSGVTACAETLSKILGLDADTIKEMRIAANLHDLGKLAIPNSILNKPGKLSEEEFLIIKSHTYYTYFIINSIVGLNHLAEWASFHHERLDGTGYPFKMHEDELSLNAKIISVADIFTALTEARPYRPRLERAEVSSILYSMVKSRAIDARAVSALLDNFNSVQEYVSNVQFAAQEFYIARMENL